MPSSKYILLDNDNNCSLTSSSFPCRCCSWYRCISTLMSQYHDLLHHWPAGAPPPRSSLLMYVCTYQRPYTDYQHTDTRRATAIVYHYASIIFVSGWFFWLLRYHITVILAVGMLDVVRGAEKWIYFALSCLSECNYWHLYRHDTIHQIWESLSLLNGIDTGLTYIYPTR